MRQTKSRIKGKRVVVINGALRGTVVERWSLTGELALSGCPPLDLTGDHLCG